MKFVVEDEETFFHISLSCVHVCVFVCVCVSLTTVINMYKYHKREEQPSDVPLLQTPLPQLLL